MSSAIEVLKKYSTSCSVCKYNGGDQCKASGGEFGECRSAEELSKAINEALLALKQVKRVTALENLADDLNNVLREKEGVVKV